MSDTRTINTQREEAALPLASFLRRVSPSNIHSDAHQLRHPGGIHAIATDRIFESILSTIGELTDIHQSSSMHPDGTELMRRMSEVIAAIQAYLDDCYLILKACWPPPATNPEEVFAERWLKKARHPTAGVFKSKVDAYRKHINSINDYIKHNHGRLRPIFMRSDIGHVVGYFLEGVLPGGSIGPHPEVHPRQTGFSFNRDLRFHLASLFRVSDALVDALKPVVTLHDVVLPTDDNVRRTRATTVMRRTAELEAKVFPDEIHKEWIAHKFDENNLQHRIVYRSLEKPRIPSWRLGWRVSSTLGGDGFANTMTFPYLGTAHQEYWRSGPRRTPGRRPI